MVRIILGRRPRCRGLMAGRGRGGWNKDVIPVFTIVGRNGHEVYIPSRDVRGETVARIASKPIPATDKHKQTTNNRDDQNNSKDIKTTNIKWTKSEP
jgi:hypothetical protein